MTRALPLACVLALAACGGGKGTPSGADAGVPADLFDNCNSIDTACPLAPGAESKGYIYPQGDMDWYVVDVPAPGLPANPLLRLQGGYTLGTNTPVTLLVNVLMPDGKTGVGAWSDPKPRGAAGALDTAFRIPGPGKYLVLVRDDPSDNDSPTQTDADKRHQYSLTASVIPDPDANEPNETTADATTLPLPGSIQGAIATPGDVDVYAVAMPAGRKLLWLHLTAPVETPPSTVQLQYELDDAQGNAVSAGKAKAAALGADLGTVRALDGPATYYLTVKAYKAPTDPYDHADPSLVYKVETQLYDELDPNEPNDTEQSATQRSMGPGSSNTFTGRVSSMADHDFYAIDVPSSGPARLFYTLARTGAGGRFPAVGLMSLRVSVLTLMQSNDQCIAECPGTCDSAYRCSWSTRVEMTGANDSMGNMVGMVPLSGAAQRVYLLVNADGDQSCDDMEYALQVKVMNEAPDEAGGRNDSEGSATAVGGPSGAAPDWSYPAMQGYFSYGRGVTADPVPSTLLPRGGSDMDATEDVDYYALTLPAGVTQDVAVGLSWKLPTNGSSSNPDRLYDLHVQLETCADATCASPQPREDVGYNGSAYWSYDAPSGTVTLLPVSCLCLPAAALASGKAYARVGILNRGTYEDLPYAVNLTLSTTRDASCTSACQ